MFLWSVWPNPEWEYWSKLEVQEKFLGKGLCRVGIHAPQSEVVCLEHPCVKSGIVTVFDGGFGKGSPRGCWLGVLRLRFIFDTQRTCESWGGGRRGGSWAQDGGGTNFNTSTVLVRQGLSGGKGYVKVPDLTSGPHQNKRGVWLEFVRRSCGSGYSVSIL